MDAEVDDAEVEERTSSGEGEDWELELWEVLGEASVEFEEEGWAEVDEHIVGVEILLGGRSASSEILPSLCHSRKKWTRERFIVEVIGRYEEEAYGYKNNINSVCRTSIPDENEDVRPRTDADVRAGSIQISKRA